MPSPADIKLLALDVDGVLTDGSIFVDDHGHEIKRFHVRDGYAIKLWQSLGFKVAIITGRSAPGVLARAKQLAIDIVMDGVSDKSAALDELVRTSGVPPHQIAFVGDDWPDLPIMTRVGLPIAVADAEPEVLKAAQFTTPRRGGNGAVRDAIEFILHAKDLYRPPVTGAPRAL